MSVQQVTIDRWGPLRATSRVFQILAFVLAFFSGQWWVPLMVMCLVVALEAMAEAVTLLVRAEEDL